MYLNIFDFLQNFIYLSLKGGRSGHYALFIQCGIFGRSTCIIAQFPSFLLHDIVMSEHRFT